MVTKRQKIVEEMQEKDKERRKKQPKRKYHGRKGHTVPDQKSWHHPLPEGYKEGSTKGKKSTVGGGKQGVKIVTPEHMKPPKEKSKSSVGGGKQGVKTVTPKHMKAPPAKRTKGTKAAPHMVKHSMGSLTGITTAEDWSKMRKMDAELDREWEKAVPSSYQGKGHGRKVVHGNKGAHRRRAAEEHMWDESMGKALKKKSKSSKRRLPKVPQRKGRTAADTQWGGYNFKDGGRIPGIRPTRKGT